MTTPIFTDWSDCFITQYKHLLTEVSKYSPIRVSSQPTQYRLVPMDAYVHGICNTVHSNSGILIVTVTQNVSVVVITNFQRLCLAIICINHTPPVVLSKKWHNIVVHEQ